MKINETWLGITGIILILSGIFFILGISVPRLQFLINIILIGFGIILIITSNKKTKFLGTGVILLILGLYILIDFSRPVYKFDSNFNDISPQITFINNPTGIISIVLIIIGIILIIMGIKSKK